MWRVQILKHADVRKDATARRSQLEALLHVVDDRHGSIKFSDYVSVAVVTLGIFLTRRVYRYFSCLYHVVRCAFPRACVMQMATAESLRTSLGRLTVALDTTEKQLQAALQYNMFIDDVHETTAWVEQKQASLRSRDVAVTDALSVIQAAHRGHSGLQLDLYVRLCTFL